MISRLLSSRSNLQASFAMRMLSSRPTQAKGVTEEDVDVPAKDFHRMKESLNKFSQCMMLGKYSAAQMVLTAHREDVERFFSRDHPAFLSVENNQALLFKMNGNTQEAAIIFERVIDKYIMYYGEEHPSTVNSILNYANVLKDMKEYEKSIDYFERAIEGRKKLEGDDSLNYAMAKAMAAAAYREVGDFVKADLYLKDAYLKAALEYGEEHISLAAILNSQGMLYKKQGKFERALDSYQRALKLKIDHFGEGHPETCATRHNIGEVYVHMN